MYRVVERKLVWDVVGDNEAVATCMTPNAAHFIAAALEDYNGEDCPLFPGNYLTVEHNETWHVVHATQRHTICECPKRNFAYFIAALYNSVLS